ncbi:MAG TPA: c-type cytochrome [Nitrospinaceae bacterium]|jgi:mono/diheme cytochrome c family protein|nr:c-type cytochrome [Nitrospinaceae bacterium]HJO01182.1 c-type cytochrome [Nitrospinaceae bacterium]|tara:strand:+ start:1859 stop:3574 length:1716 start_codon:yes stop_codon:yes gene_type:complete
MINKMKTGKKLIFLLALMVSFLLVGTASAGIPDPVQQDLLEKGKKVYFKRCVWCHGVEGGGDGPSADRLFTRPRNFIQGTFKIRTTDSGQLPKDEDLFKTVKNGLPGSAMPAWGEFLKEDEIKAVIQFVKTLVQDRDFNDAEDEEVELMEFGSNPWGTTGPYHLGVPQEAIDAGKEIFTANKCFECHGGEGRGDGNPTMKDDWGFPILAADWSQCWNFRGSRRNHFDPFNVVRTVSTGLNGTPMPNFREKITVEDRWKLAAFVNSLCPRKKIDKLTSKPIPDFLISSIYTEGDIAEKIDDPMWQSSDNDPLIVARSEEKAVNPRKNYIALAGQITRGKRNFDPKVDNLWVSSRWNKDKGLYYLVEYHLRFLSSDPEFPDAVAIQWPAKLQDLFGAEKPYFIMGDSKKPVDVWRASFMPKDYSSTNAPKEEGYQLDVTVDEFNGRGFDALEPKETEATVKVVDSIFHQGRVKILFHRALTTDGEMDVQIPPEQFIPISFFQWAGDDKEKDEHMAISTWYYTILEPPLPESLYYMPPIMAVVFVGLQGWLVWMTKRTRKMYADGKVKRDDLPF